MFHQTSGQKKCIRFWMLLEFLSLPDHVCPFGGVINKVKWVKPIHVPDNSWFPSTLQKSLIRPCCTVFVRLFKIRCGFRPSNHSQEYPCSSQNFPSDKTGSGDPALRCICGNLISCTQLDCSNYGREDEMFTAYRHENLLYNESSTVDF